MRSFSKIIVEQTNGRWTAWFNDVPEIRVARDDANDAIQRLLDEFGVDQFDFKHLHAIDYATSDWHREFLIPLRHHRRIPIPSAK